MIKYHCDRCGKEIPKDKKVGCIVNYDELKRAVSQDQIFDLCPDCQKKLMKFLKDEKES